ncbi:DUF6053 domain-containing protein [Lysobacter enzymogenes]|uniref:DUF6053 domain-containing protein n=1 Tax=Lysobacter enzymogenes TaxID=69 RepID=UPI003D2F8674
MGGTLVPMPLFQLEAIGHKSVGTEVPPTEAAATKAVDFNATAEFAAHSTGSKNARSNR